MFGYVEIEWYILDRSAKTVVYCVRTNSSPPWLLGILWVLRLFLHVLQLTAAHCYIAYMTSDGQWLLVMFGMQPEKNAVFGCRRCCTPCNATETWTTTWNRLDWNRRSVLSSTQHVEKKMKILYNMLTNACIIHMQILNGDNVHAVGLTVWYADTANHP